MIIFGIFLVLAAGSCNIYPLYLKQMMDKFGFTLKQVNLYGSFINIGLWVAFTMGMVFDKFGPKLSCIIGAALLSGSYAVLHLIMNSDIKSISLFPMLLLAILMGQGSALCYTAAVTTNLKNFFVNNSAIVGILVTNMALSPSLFTMYRDALPNVKMAEYFLIISVFLAIVILSCGWVFTNLTDLYSEHEKLKGYQFYKEKKIIWLLVLLNIFILVIYIFGVIFNNLNSDNRFPNAIIYPCLQLLNFLFIIFEYFGVWEKLYFREFIEKELRKQMEFLESQAEKNRDNNIKVVNNKVENRIRDPKEEEKIQEIQNNNLNDNHVVKIVENSLGNTKYNSNLINQSKKKRKNSFDYSHTNGKEFENIEDNKPNYLNNASYRINPEYQKHIRSLFNFEGLDGMEVVQGIENNIHMNNIAINNVNKKDRPSYIDEQPQIHHTIENNLPEVAEHLGLKNNESELKKFLILITTKENLILFTILTLGVGSAIANLNNIQFIISSIKINPSSKEIFEYAILYFAFNSFTRIVSGIIIDKLIEKKMIFHFLVFTSIMGFVSQGLGAVMDKNLLLFSISLAGATHGGYMTFTPIYTRQFGIENMGKVLGFLTTGCAFGSFFVANFLFTIFYDHYTINDKCFGAYCYKGAFILTTVLLFINIILSYILLHLNKKKLSSNS
jgi:MFS family permease